MTENAWTIILIVAFVIVIIALILDKRQTDRATTPDDADVIHVNPRDEDDLQKLYTVTNRMYEHQNNCRHPKTNVVIDGTREDMRRVDEYFQAAARQIERRGGEQFTIEYRKGR